MAQSSSAWISGRKGMASVCPTGRPWVGAPRSRERRYLAPLVRSYIPLCDSSQSLCQVPSPILLREYAKSVVIVQLQTQRTEQRVKDIGIGFYARRGRYTATVPLLYKAGQLGGGWVDVGTRVLVDRQHSVRCRICQLTVSEVGKPQSNELRAIRLHYRIRAFFRFLFLRSSIRSAQSFSDSVQGVQSNT